MGKPPNQAFRIIGVLLAAIAAFALIGGAVYFGLDYLNRIPPSTSLVSSSTGSPTPSATTASTTRAANPGQSDKQLMQHLVEMILSDARFDELYSLIPAAQRPDIEKDTFVQYVSLLRRGIRGKITAFVPMTGTELGVVRDEILANSLRYSYLTESLSGYWIIYQTTNGTEERFAVFLHQLDNGMYVFSKDWIDGILALNSYATLYFDAIEKGNADALSVLVFSEINDSAIRSAKANATIRFYRECVTVKAIGFRLLYARADSFGYEQSGINYGSYLTYQASQQETPKLPVATPSAKLTATPAPTPTPTPLPAPDPAAFRQVRIVKTGLDQMKVEDVIPQNLTLEDVSVYSKGQPILALGEYVFSFELNKLFGERISYRSMPAVEPFDSTLEFVRAEYPDVTITLIGTSNEKSQAFQGNVFAVDIRKPDFATGAGISVGATRKAILARYPFADLTEWAGAMPTAFDRVDFNMVLGNITGIRISRRSVDLENAIARAALVTPSPVPSLTVTPRP